MHKIFIVLGALCCAIQLKASAAGVSPYLPLDLEPEIERQIERVLILGQKPVLTRPIAAATVLNALPKACQRDEELCREVRHYLNRFMRDLGVMHASIEGYSASGDEYVVPNAYGRSTDSGWAASALGLWQPTDHVLLSVGGVAYQGKTNPTGSLVSLGIEHAQLDIGYRGHWLSPMSDSAMLISTEAATMPSMTLSNYAPLTRYGLHYELFVAEMSSSDRIVFRDRFTTGHPHIGGIHLSAEPVSGWALGFNRILQFGGGERKPSNRDVIDAFINPSRYDNADFNLDPNAEFGNQVAAITSSFIFPGRTPFSVYFEYAGEDTSNGKVFLLGNSSISAGIHFPSLWRRFDFTLEASDWQNGWYVHHIYQDGLVNDGRVIGNWFGDQQGRNGVGGQSQMARLGWYPAFGGSFDLRLRALQSADYGPDGGRSGRDTTLAYSRPFGPVVVGGEILNGRDLLGENFTQFGVFVRLNDGAISSVAPASAGAGDDSGEIFVSAGASGSVVHIDLDFTTPTTNSGTDIAPYLGVGARRPVSARSDLGARVEITQADSKTLLAIRALDYRYRTKGPLAITAFLGAARYSLATSAQGLYGGFGAEWRDIIKGWNLGADVSCGLKVARDPLLPDDPGTRDRFYNIYRGTLSLTRHF